MSWTEIEMTPQSSAAVYITRAATRALSLRVPVSRSVHVAVLARAERRRQATPARSAPESRVPARSAACQCVGWFAGAGRQTCPWPPAAPIRQDPDELSRSTAERVASCLVSLYAVRAVPVRAAAGTPPPGADEDGRPRAE